MNHPQETKTKRRNRQPLERILTVARSKMSEADRAPLFANAAEYDYYRGVVDTLEHVLGHREVFKFEKQVSVNYDLKVA
jgi:hypothetical protein